MVSQIGYCVNTNSSTALRNQKKKKDTRVLNCNISQDPLWEANNSLSQTSTPRPWGRCCYKSREPHFHACTAARDRRVGASQSLYRAPKPTTAERETKRLHASGCLNLPWRSILWGLEVIRGYRDSNISFSPTGYQEV